MYTTTLLTKALKLLIKMGSCGGGSCGGGAVERTLGDDEQYKATTLVLRQIVSSLTPPKMYDTDTIKVKIWNFGTGISQHFWH